MAKYSKINYIDPKELIPYDKNAKTHPQDQLDKLVRLMENYGYPDGKAVICGEDKVIIHGHGRTLAAIAAGLKEIPYQVVTDISEADKIAWRIADNAVSESPWDYALLAEDLIQLDELDFDMDLLALNEEQLAILNSDSFLDDIPEENNDINEDELEKTKHECPECGFKW